MTVGTNDKNENRSQGVGKVSSDILLKFCDPSLSRERFELETSNLACRLTIGGINDKNEKLGQKGS